MNNSMFRFKQELETKCKSNSAVPISKELFLRQDEFENFEKQLAELSIPKPINACDFLKHPKIFSAISVLPQMTYEKDKEKTSTPKDLLNELEVEHSRKFYISKILSLKEAFYSIEKEFIEKKRALDIADFYLKGLVACAEINCPESIKKMMVDRTPKMSSYIVYGKDFSQIFLDENNFDAFYRIDYRFSQGLDFTYNKSKAMKDAIKGPPSKLLLEKLKYMNPDDSHVFAVINQKDWSEILRSKADLNKYVPQENELTSSKFISKNVIGFARPYSYRLDNIVESQTNSKEIAEARNLILKTYDISLVPFTSPDWNSKQSTEKMNDNIKKTEIEYEVDFFNIYGTVNSVNGNWFLIKDSMNKEFWINQNQFYHSVSISSLLSESNLVDGVKFYESPAGAMIKTNSSDLLFPGFEAKAFKWINDQLWIMIDTASDEPCWGEEDTAKSRKSKKPLTNIWMKAFKDDGRYNFMHTSRGC